MTNIQIFQFQDWQIYITLAVNAIFTGLGTGIGLIIANTIINRINHRKKQLSKILNGKGK